MHFDGVSTHLSGRFPEYTNWNVSSEKGYVSDVYGGNPLEIDNPNSYNLNPNPHIVEAKRQAGITYDAIGCGPLAMIS